MLKPIALSLLLLPLSLGGAAYAGKLGGNAANHNQPTMVSGTSSQCHGPQHHYLNGACGDAQTTTPTAPHGGCGYYGPNGTLIRCE